MSCSIPKNKPEIELNNPGTAKPTATVPATANVATVHLLIRGQVGRRTAKTTTAQTIDEEVSKIIEGQYERAKRILAENRDKLTALASQLLEKEVIFKEDLEKIFGDRPFAKAVEPAKPNGSTNGKGAAAEETTDAAKEDRKEG